MARLIGIISGKGGVGKTTIASNLSYALSKFGQKVVAIDCNITTPHLSSYMPDFSWRASLNDVMKGKADIFLAMHYNNGIYIVPASPNLEDLIGVDISNLREVMQPLRAADNLVILDSAPGLGKESISVLSSCTEVLFVTVPQRPAVNDILKCIKVAEEIGVKQLGLVLNMCSKQRYNLTAEEVEEITGLNVIGNIDFDKKIIDSVLTKKPLVILR